MHLSEKNQEYNPSELLSTLVYIKQKFGIELFFDAHKLTAIVLDLSPQLGRDIKIIKRIVETGLLEGLKQNGIDYQKEKVVFAKIQHWLVEEEYIQEERASQYVLVLKKVLACTEEVLKDEGNEESISLEKTIKNENIEKNGQQQEQRKNTFNSVPEFFYEIKKDNTIKITGIKGNTDSYTNIFIPMTVNGRLVTSVERNNTRKIECKSVDIPSSVRKIDNDAFSGYTAINVDPKNKYYKSVDGILFNKDLTELIHYPCTEQDKTYMIPSNVRVIASHAFRKESAYCKLGKLKIIIHDAILLIRERAFTGELVSVEVSNDNPNYSSYKGSLFNKEQTKIIHYGKYEEEEVYQILNGVSVIGRYAFYDCETLYSVILPDTVTGINDHAFCACKNLQEIIFSKNIRGIGESAFKDCESLTKLSFPEGLLGVGGRAFEGCKNLSSLIFPTSIREIKYASFSGCDALLSVAIGAYVEICRTAFPSHTKILRTESEKNFDEKDACEKNTGKKKWFSFFK